MSARGKLIIINGIRNNNPIGNEAGLLCSNIADMKMAAMQPKYMNIIIESVLL